MTSSSLFHSKKNWSLILAVFTILLFALVGRFWRLADYPAGLHQDEAWFAYNSWLMLQNGANIYGQKWPLTVDMWGDHVPAIHSYVLMPFIAVLGENTFAFRTGIVVVGLLAAVVAGWWLYRQTKNKVLILLAAVMLATSPWAIVMSRASSSVMIDSLVLSVTVLVASVVIARAAKQKKAGLDLQLWLGVGAVYLLTIACYVTYFTSRLLIPPYLVGLGVYYWWLHRTTWRLQLTLAIVVMIGLYLFFPFGYYLRTPYALGRYQETAIMGSDAVKAALANHISQSGQTGLPTWLTRLRYNKATENLTAFWQQYVELISPSVLLFHNGPPARYEVPNGLSVTVFEYIGILLAAASLLLLSKKSQADEEDSLVGTSSETDLRPLIALCLFFTLTAAVPSALTKDDFPNLQRAVIMIPWLQLTAALGWFAVLRTWLRLDKANWEIVKKVKKMMSSPLGLTLVVLLLSAPSLLSFWFGYVVETPHQEPFYRSRAGEELAKWINANAHDSKIIEDHVEGVFFYPYLFAHEDLRKLPIKLSDPYFLTSKDFWIGNRHFVSELCTSKEMHEQEYDYYILFELFDHCGNADGMMKVFQAKYDDGTVGFTVYKKYIPPNTTH